MADICLSPVLGLRCLGLSHIQEAVTLVPIGLEVIFSLGLVLAGRDAGRYVRDLCEPVMLIIGTSYRIRYLLAAEAPILLLLGVLSFLSHVVSVFENNITPFEALDITIGAHSRTYLIAIQLTQRSWFVLRRYILSTHPFLHDFSLSLQSEGILSTSSNALHERCEGIFVCSDPSDRCDQ